MNPYAIPSLLAFVVNLSLGVYILSKGAKYLLNRIYALLAFSVAIWAFGEFMWRSANNAEQAFLWNRIAGFGYCFTAPLLVNFILIFSKRREILQRKITHVALYLPSLIFLYLLWKTDLLTKGMIKVKWGYTYLGGTLDWIWALWSTTLIILALYLCIQFYRKTKIKRERMQARFVFIGIFISCVTALTTDIFLPLVKIHVLTMCIASTVAMVGFIAYAITRYRLFVFTPSTAAGDILATMGDSLILVGSDGGILSVNRATEEILEYKEKDLAGKSLATIFEEGTSILKELTEKGIIHDYEITYRTKNGDSIPVSFSGSVMKDKAGEIIGIVCIAHDMREIKRLMQKERELSLAEAQAETEKKRAEELHALNQQLRASEQQLKAANQQLRASEQQLRASNQQLAAKEQALRVSQEDLRKKMADLERFNRLMVGRELEMVKLKDEVNSLLEKLRQPKKYEAPEKMK